MDNLVHSEISDPSLKPSGKKSETEILTVNKLALMNTVVLGKLILAYPMTNISNFDKLNV
jgi:hypothetical protein